MYLNRKIRDLEREVQINKTETIKGATVAAKAGKELDIVGATTCPSGVAAVGSLMAG